MSLGGGEEPAARAPTLESRYNRALELVKGKEYDAAYLELQDIAQRGANTKVGSEASRKLQVVTAGILSYPGTPITSLLASPQRFTDRYVTLRGTFQTGGPVGASTNYFFIKDGRTVQCRYAQLPLAVKQRILATKEGTRVMVRGVAKPAWGTNPDPYVDATMFRNE